MSASKAVAEAAGTDAASVWVLADPRPGTANQALGIAERLGVPVRVVPLAWGPLARLPWPWPTLAGLGPAARALLRPPWPRVVISAGRRSAPIALWLKQHGARAVHAMRPGFGASSFDLLVLGQHDRPPQAPNVIAILGACHRLSPAVLAAARTRWCDLPTLPSPRVAVLVGGPVRGQRMADAEARGLIRAVRDRFPGGSFLVSTSRRTGRHASAAIAEALAGVPHRLFRWGDAGENPYAGFLAWAEAIVVTADSVSMLAEACATAAPVFVAGDAAGRHARLVASLVAAGRVARLGEPAPSAVVPIDEAGRVAAEIRARGWLG
ncbi:mitochondrial fission ELM1 family protein [Elioraea thermophila]|uniref:mitochondrial fission ELM1 family protein n=1 Tax=Elioraea thermophila TaxID=2185104 RepID=UPI001E503D23|nr:mitochondrial fission ELM1 family protein [Elioraea thermophila]